MSEHKKTKKVYKSKKEIRYPKPKRTHKEAFENINNKDYNPIKKKKNIKNKNKEVILIKKEQDERDNGIMTFDLNYIYNVLYKNSNNNKIQINKEDLQNQLYENNFFDIIDITGDGNCFFRCISYFLYNTENQHYNIRLATYNYIKNNLTKFYEYCYVENGIYYIDIEQGTQIKKYILDEYVENIKISRFFSGFIEMNAISIIYNRPLIVLDDKYFNNIYSFFNKIALFNNNENMTFNLEDIIFINYVNKNHYQLIKPNIEFILNRMEKKINLEFNLIIFNKKKNQIEDIRNDISSILEIKNINNLIEKNETNKEENNFELYNLDKSINSNLSSSQNTKKEIVNNKGENQKESHFKSKKIDFEFSDSNNKESKQKKFNTSLSENNNRYKDILKNYKDKYIEIKDKDITRKILIPKYPILIKDKINQDFYPDIYRYLYIEKYNLNISKYSQTLNNIKPTNRRENKKRELRKKFKKYYLDEDNKLCRKIIVNKKEKEKLNLNSRFVEIENINYRLLYIPETLNILKFLNDKHIEDGHKGISSLRNYLSYNNIYFEGATYLTEYIVKNCTSCAGKNKSKLKREPGKKIITYYPKQRYIMDITELPLELKAHTYFLYLFSIIDHFSKYGMSFLIKIKEAKTILNYQISFRI